MADSRKPVMKNKPVNQVSRIVYYYIHITNHSFLKSLKSVWIWYWKEIPSHQLCHMKTTMIQVVACRTWPVQLAKHVSITFSLSANKNALNKCNYKGRRPNCSVLIRDFYTLLEAHVKGWQCNAHLWSVIFKEAKWIKTDIAYVCVLDILSGTWRTLYIKAWKDQKRRHVWPDNKQISRSK